MTCFKRSRFGISIAFRHVVKKLRVLIVEDREEDCLLSVRELRRAGFSLEYQRVDTANRMRHALTENAWDLILADYDLPQFTGVDALRLARAQGIEVPFIIVSGNTSDDAVREAITAGAADYISKDDVGRLVPTVKRELGLTDTPGAVS